MSFWLPVLQPFARFRFFVHAEVFLTPLGCYAEYHSWVFDCCVLFFVAFCSSRLHLQHSIVHLFLFSSTCEQLLGDAGDARKCLTRPATCGTSFVPQDLAVCPIYEEE